MSKKYDVVVIGAGPAGLTTAINSSIAGWKVMVVEKSLMPRVKVCGGFIGPENKKLFAQWGILDDLMCHGANQIKNIVLGSANGSLVKAPILMDGKEDFGLAISRKQLDWSLMKKAQSVGVKIRDQAIASVLSITAGIKRIQIKDLKNKVVNQIEAYHMVSASGALNNNSQKGKGMFGVAANFKDILDMKENVFLYFSDQSHLGINKFENGETNICYVVDKELFHSMNGNMQKIYSKLKDKNPLLRKQLKSSKQLTPWKGMYFSKSQSFRFYDDVMFYVGDAVGQINPVVGGGNSIAISSALLLSEIMKNYKPQNMPAYEVARAYEMIWKKNFSKRIEISWILGSLAHNKMLSNYTIKLFQCSNKLLNKVFNHTHQAIAVENMFVRT